MEKHENILYYQDFLYMPKILCSKIIYYQYNNPLAEYFGIKKA